MSVKDLGKVIYFQNHIVVHAGESPLKEKQILTDEEARKYRETFGEKIDIRIGAEAVKELLKEIDIEELSGRLAIEMRQATSAQRRTKIIKRLKVVEAFRGSDNKPEWMVLDVLPVIPPELRPLVHLDGGRFATSDLNDLYRRVINRNNRLKKLMELKAPEVILQQEHGPEDAGAEHVGADALALHVGDGLDGAVVLHRPVDREAAGPLTHVLGDDVGLQAALDRAVGERQRGLRRAVERARNHGLHHGAQCPGTAPIRSWLLPSVVNCSARRISQYFGFLRRDGPADPNDLLRDRSRRHERRAGERERQRQLSLRHGNTSP